MRLASFSLAIIVASCATRNAASDRVAPSDGRAEHARKMVRAMDDYDAQLLRRQRQLERQLGLPASKSRSR